MDDNKGCRTSCSDLASALRLASCSRPCPAKKRGRASAAKLSKAAIT